MSTITRINDTNLLRRAVQLDAVATGAMALLLVLAAAPLAGLLHLPETLLRGAGGVLLAYVAFLGWLLLRERIGAPMAWTVITINAVWTLASFVLLAAGWGAPNVLGVTFVVAQALAVLVFAELQYVGLKRSRRG
ncbi:MAG TPA: hypothetical protein VGD21_11880 [Lysobacter sp.]